MTEPMAHPRTICARCIHPSFEYGNWICFASPLPRAIDPVSGRETPFSVNADEPSSGVTLTMLPGAFMPIAVI